MDDTPAPVSMLGTLPVERERWRPVRGGFLWWRPKPPQLPPLKFLDWTVDGLPLRDRLTVSESQPCTGIPLMSEGSEDPMDDGVTAESLRALLPEAQSGADRQVRFDDGRTALLFCELCGDLDCGAVSAQVVFTAETAEWRDVAFQAGITGELFTSDVPAFTIRFDRGQYEETVRALLSGWALPAP